MSISMKDAERGSNRSQRRLYKIVPMDIPLEPTDLAGGLNCRKTDNSGMNNTAKPVLQVVI